MSTISGTLVEHLPGDTSAHTDTALTEALLLVDRKTIRNRRGIHADCDWNQPSESRISMLSIDGEWGAALPPSAVTAPFI